MSKDIELQIKKGCSLRELVSAVADNCPLKDRPAILHKAIDEFYALRKLSEHPLTKIAKREIYSYMESPQSLPKEPIADATKGDSKPLAKEEEKKEGDPKAKLETTIEKDHTIDSSKKQEPLIAKLNEVAGSDTKCVKEKAEEQKGQLKSLSKDSSTSTYDNKSGAYQKQLNSLNPNAATPNNYWELIKAKHYNADEEKLTGYHFFSKNEASCVDTLFDGYIIFSKIYAILGQSKLELLNRSLGAFIGGLIGDSYGSLTEFAFPDYDRKIITDFEEKYYYIREHDIIINHCELSFGQWSDDSSMSMCIADSLIDLMAYDEFDIKTRFYAWINMGYDNAFKYDTKRSYRGSVGLGATIGQSLLNFGKNLDNLSAIKKGSDNAIGTIMRLHPIPIFFHDNLTECLKCASSQSYLTHNGIEASDCAKIMAYFMYEGINMQTKPKTAKEFLDYCTDPKNEDYKMLYSQLETIGGKCLLESKKEELKDFIKNEYNLTIDDRNWNWKEKLYRFSLTRVNKSQGYVGSYAMDSLAIALSYMYFSQDFMSMMTALVNIGGDSDSFGAVAGGIAGAYYGIEGIKKEWYNAVFKWDKGESILRVFHMLRIDPLFE